MPDLLIASALPALLVGTQAFFTWLEVVNLRHEAATIDRETDWIRAELDVDDPSRIVDYHRVKTGVSLLQQWSLIALVLLVLYSGLFADLVTTVQLVNRYPFLAETSYVVVIILGLRLVSAPFDLVDTFVVEETFDFNEQSPGLWLRDFLVGTLVSLLIAVPVAVAVFWVVGNVPYWPVAAWALVMAIQLSMLVIKPRVIDPLFYDFEAVESGELREAVDGVFERAGFACEQIYEMDASSRSSHSNAYFVGFGRTKRVVLFDTLVEAMRLPEVQSVLAHELAHWKRGHIWKFVALAGVQLGLVFVLIGYLSSADWLLAPFAVPATTYVLLTIALLWVLPMGQLLSPLRNFFSLRYEREADAFAAETVGGEPMANALASLAAENLAGLFPHPLYETFHHSHPPIPERMRAVRDVERSGGEATDVGEEAGEAPRRTGSAE